MRLGSEGLEFLSEAVNGCGYLFDHAKRFVRVSQSSEIVAGGCDGKTDAASGVTLGQHTPQTRLVRISIATVSGADPGWNKKGPVSPFERCLKSNIAS